MKVLKFGAVWCPGCLVMRPRWQEIEKENPWLNTEYHDADEKKDLLQKYQIKDLPCFIFWDRRNQEITRLVGERSKEELVKLINLHREK